MEPPPPPRVKKPVARKWSILEPIFADYVRRRGEGAAVGDEAAALSDEIERRHKADQNAHAKWRKRANLPGKLSMLRGSETEPPTLALAAEQEDIRKLIKYDADAKKTLCDIDSAIASIGVRKRAVRGLEKPEDIEPDITLDDATDALEILCVAARIAPHVSDTAPSALDRANALNTILRVAARGVTSRAWREDMEADDDVTDILMDRNVVQASKIRAANSDVRAKKRGHEKHKETWDAEEDASLVAAMREHGMNATLPARTEDAIIHRRFKIFSDPPYFGDAAKVMAAFPLFTAEDMPFCLQHTHHRKRKRPIETAQESSGDDVEEDEEDEEEEEEEEEEEDEEEEEEDEEDEEEGSE